LPAEENIRFVLSILTGGTTIAQAARQAKASDAGRQVEAAVPGSRLAGRRACPAGQGCAPARLSVGI